MKVNKDLWVWVMTPDLKTPVQDNNGALTIVTADTQLEAWNKIRSIRGVMSIPQDCVVSCSIHHGRSALYIKK